MAILVDNPPCILHEDEHLLVVNKPAGLNTHAPSPYAGEGIYEWLKHREARWASLAIVHRLDKATSGVILFAKTKLANRSLTEQFAKRTVSKQYLLLTPKTPPSDVFTVRTGIERVGERYQACPPHSRTQIAETKFEILGKLQGYVLLSANPVTGRTHQIRVHASERKFPILGDDLYGGNAFSRVCLHSHQLTIHHPQTRQLIQFTADPEFFADAALQLRRLVIDSSTTDSFRLFNGAADSLPDTYIDKWGEYLLLQSERDPTQAILDQTVQLAEQFGCIGVYHKTLNRQVRRAAAEESTPRHLSGKPALKEFVIRENGVHFEASFDQGYSAGLFFDQRENRRRLITGHVAADFELFPNGLKERAVLNTFAYTCGFSVCAAMAGARTTSLDLSKKYLDWGRRNFTLNNLNHQPHDFIFGDVFEWSRRLARKDRKFDVIVLDPPTFSQSRDSGVFQAEKHFAKLTAAVLPLLNPEGILLASSNAHKFEPEEFLTQIKSAITRSHRKILAMHYVPQPMDFPIHKDEPAYLKSVWLRVS